MSDAAPAPMPVTASVVDQPVGYGRYAEESGYRAVVTPVDTLDTGYAIRYAPGQRWRTGPKLWLFVDLPAAACTTGSIIDTEHVNGSRTATLVWQVVDPASSPTRKIPRWLIRSVVSMIPWGSSPGRLARPMSLTSRPTFEIVAATSASDCTVTARTAERDRCESHDHTCRGFLGG